MSSDSQIKDIETKLNALSERYKAQRQNAQDLIDIDQDNILICLQDGVESVQTILKSLEDAQDINVSAEEDLLISFDYVTYDTPNIPRACVTEDLIPIPRTTVALGDEDLLTSFEDATIDTPKIPGAWVTEYPVSESRNTVALGKRCTQISACFTRLSNLADKQLEDIMEIQLAAMDIEDELDRLKAGLEETTENAQMAVITTRESLERKKTEKKNAQSRLTTVEAELRAVENKASENKTHRQVAKFVKFGALVVAPVFPLPAIGVAAAGQIGHMVLQDKKQDLIKEKEAFDAQNQLIQTQVASFEQQSRDLKSSLATKTKMSSRCVKMSKQVQQAKKELICRANEYQTLKEASGDFLSWTEELQNRAELMENFDEREEIERGVRKLVGALERCDREEVKVICAPLRRMLLD